MLLEQRAVLGVLPDLAGRRVLDLACGTGRYAHLALQRGAGRVVGTDSNWAMLRRGSPFTRLRADLVALPFARSTFDVVVCGLALGHLPPARMPQAMAEISRIMDRAGVLVFSDFHPGLFLAGHRRTFTARGGGTYNVEHHPHLVVDYFNAIGAAGLTVTALVEATAPVDGREMPAILIMAARRTEGAAP